MIYRNYKRPNIYRQLLDTYTEENKPISSGIVKAFSSQRFKWVAQYMFKAKNNTATNKHKAWVAFFSDYEMTLTEYANIQYLQSRSLWLGEISRPQLPVIYHELSSKQYKKIGQEYVEYDEIAFADPSNLLLANGDSDTGYNLVLGEAITEPSGITDEARVVTITHTYGDAPVFVATGYKFHGYLGKDWMDFANPPSRIALFNDRVEVYVNDDPKDIYTHYIFNKMVQAATPICTGTL